MDKRDSGLLVNPNVYIQAKWSRTYSTTVIDLLVERADSPSLVPRKLSNDASKPLASLSKHLAAGGERAGVSRRALMALAASLSLRYFPPRMLKFMTRKLL